MDHDHRRHRCADCGREWWDDDLRGSVSVWPRDEKGNLVEARTWPQILVMSFAVLERMVEDAAPLIVWGAAAFALWLCYVLIFR